MWTKYGSEYDAYLIFVENGTDSSKKIAKILISESLGWNSFFNKTPFVKLATNTHVIKVIIMAHQVSLSNGTIRSCHFGLGGGIFTKKQT